jgi:hypothetical protein
MEAAVQLLASVISLLTPLPYFRPILMTVADKVLDAGEMYSNSVSDTARTARPSGLKLTMTSCSSVDSSFHPREITLNWPWL